MEAVVAAGDHPGRLLGLDFVQADGAVGVHHQIFAGHLGELLEIGGGEASVLSGLYRRAEMVHVLRLTVASARRVAKQANVNEENDAHSGAW